MKDIFGNDKVGAAYASTGANTIWGSWFTCPKHGKAESISLYWRHWVSSRVKCAIYRKSDGALIGYTEEKFLGKEHDMTWQTFKIVEGGQLEAGVDYWLVAWFDHGGARVFDYQLYKGIWAEAPYNAFPEKLPTGRTVHENVSIYCTYTPTAPPTPPAPPGMEWLPIAIGALSPIIFGLAVIGASELTKKK